MTSSDTDGSHGPDGGGAPAGLPRLVRVVLIALALLLAVVLLFTVVFPWFDETFVNDPVLGVTAPPAAAADAD
jgi:hypothetical protein